MWNHAWAAWFSLMHLNKAAFTLTAICSIKATESHWFSVAVGDVWSMRAIFHNASCDFLIQLVFVTEQKLWLRVIVKKKKKDIKNYILSDAVIWNIEEFLIILEWMRWFCWGVFGICVENKNYFKKVKNYLLLWRRFLSANQTWTEFKKKNKKNSFHIPTVLDQFNMAIK